MKLTPMLEQYLRVKGEHPDALLFFRLGDFYELFFEDAEKAARLLDLTLTSRNKKDDVPIPMCGLPYHSAQPYIAKLLAAGMKVAICEQVQDPATAQGLVPTTPSIPPQGAISGPALVMLTPMQPSARAWLAARTRQTTRPPKEVCSR